MSGDDQIDRYRLALEGVLGIPMSEGNRVEAFRNGCRIFPPMLEAIAGARESIEMLTFVYWRGDIARRFAAALEERARAGVRVRVLLDGVGARPMPNELVQRMEAAGVDVRWFRPPVRWRVWQADNRTHRKVLICDDEVGFTGGVGIAAEWEGDARHPGEWRETHFRVRGPAVHGLRAAFLGNWAETGGLEYEDVHALRPAKRHGESLVQVVRTTASVGWSDIATVLRLLLSMARRRLDITSAYFVPDEVTADLLCEAVGRGVAVRVLVPGPHDDSRLSQLAGEDMFQRLLNAGVEIYCYQPTMLHAKVLTVDGVVSCVGSANFNQRSMRKDDEICLLALDRELTAHLEADFQTDLQSSERTTSAAWRRRGWGQRLLEWFTRPLRGQV